MATVVQRYPALVFQSASFLRAEVRCSASANGDGFKVPERAGELKLASQQMEEISLEVEGPVKNAGFVKEVRDRLKDKSAGELALYGGIASMGLAIGGTVLSSLEILPLVPEALQAVGVGYSMLVAGRVLKGKKNLIVSSSPFKAIIELVESEDLRFQRTTVVLPRDMDETVRQALEKLAKERDAAVNKVEEMKKAASDYARVVAEKEALEAVAMELVKERDTAISEVSGLRKAVEAMQGRIASVEQVLAKEVQQFRQQNETLEALASQLATERDSAMKEVAELKKIASQSERSEAEKLSLETVAMQLASERDTALAELEELKKVVANLRGAEDSGSSSGLTLEQEIFIKEKVMAVRSQFIDIAQGYDKQQDEVQKFVSHLVEEYGAPRDWTLNYMKQFLDAKIVGSQSHVVDSHGSLWDK